MKAFRLWMSRAARALLLVVVLSADTSAQSAARPPRGSEASAAMKSAQQDLAADRPLDAVTKLRRVTEIAPAVPAGWYVLGHAYNAVVQDAIGTFSDRPEDLPWRQLLLADAFMSDGRLTDAFALYRQASEHLPSMISIHDSIARIYEQTGHQDWAAKERASTPSAPDCTARKPMCEFRAGRYAAAYAAALRGTDDESRYWLARAATELALAAFKRLEGLPDSRERREVRATMAQASRRYTDAIAEFQAALKFAPGDEALRADLGSTYFFAGDYEKAVATLLPLVKAHDDDAQLLGTCGKALLQLQRIEEAVPLLQRSADLDTSDSGVRLALARAYIAKEYFAAAVPLLELDLADDADGGVHVQLARAYKGLGKDEKAAELLARSQELQRASQERGASAGERKITPPK
jgi:predicted Zn-dependent protease